MDPVDNGNHRTAKMQGPAQAISKVRTSYLICCLPRTGSWLLSEMLQSTGIAGRPREYLAPERRKSLERELGISPTAGWEAYMAKAFQKATTPNGVLGIKVHWYQFERFLGDFGKSPWCNTQDPARSVQSLFPHLRYIHLVRADRVRHAVSYARAAETKLWWQIDAQRAAAPCVLARTPTFDRARLDRFYQLITGHASNWQQYFNQNNITPFRIRYEELIANPEGTLKSIFDYLQVNFPAGALLPLPRLKKQADDLSEEWVSLYRRAREAGEASA
jgi:trehalose 2-sulfotransferase